MRRVLAFVASFALAHAAATYGVVSLGSYGGSYATGTRIAANGQASVWALDGNDRDVAVGNGSVLSTSAQANAINSSGEVVGTTIGSDGARATVWHSGIADLVLGTESYGLGINEAGDIAGSRLSNGQMRAFVSSGNSITDLATGGIWSTAYDINSFGSAAGSVLRSNGTFRAFVSTTDGGVTTIGTLGGSNSYAQALNDSGAVVGTSQTTSGALRAFLYDGVLRDLGTLGGTLSAAYDIDSAGHVVGYSLDSTGRSRAFLWVGGVMIDLNSLIDPASGWTLDAAYGVNDAGQIVGSGTWNGQSTAFRLDPLRISNQLQRADVVEPVPEPSWLLPVGSVLLLVAHRAFRQRSAPGD
jgi:probable HAF family extracellular repeat protein